MAIVQMTAAGLVVKKEASAVRGAQLRVSTEVLARARRSRAVNDDTQRVDFADVEVLAATDFVLRCRVEGKFVGVPALRVLPGTEVARRGDRGHLVLPVDLAETLGLIA